ncbi:MAG: hypothetical protein WCH11_04360 [Bdellovibrio sp.]
MRNHLMFVFLFWGVWVFGATGSASSSEEKLKPTKKSTDVSFEDVLVQGRYQFSDEAVTTVEEDKVLDALLAVRKDFRDRVEKSKDQK